MSILSSLRYCLGPPDDHTNMWIALAFIPFGLFFDFMDGKVARWRKKSSLMGQELDSLADLVGHSHSRILYRDFVHLSVICAAFIPVMEGRGCSE